MNKITLVSISISILLTGCFNSWSKEEIALVKMQAKSIADIYPKTKKKEFIECFSNYAIDNYDFKDYMNSGTAGGLSAMTNCNKYIVK